MQRGISISASIERRTSSIIRVILQGDRGTDVRRLLAAGDHLVEGDQSLHIGSDDADRNQSHRDSPGG